MATIHLLIGPVGAGKSTKALQLAIKHSALVLNLDHWMVTLFSMDRPRDDVMSWYGERADRCLNQIWSVAEQVIATGNDVVLEVGLIQRAPRLAFYSRVDAADLDIVVHLLDAPREIRRARVLKRNSEQGPTFAMHVPLEIFELASDLWEPPDDNERRTRNIAD